MNGSPPVVIIGPAHPLRGGIAQFNESLCASLTENGVPCIIVGYYLQYPALLFPGKTQLNHEAAPVGINIVNLLSSVNPISWWRTAQAIIGMEPRCVLIRFWIPFMGPALGTIARLLRKKGIEVIGLVDNATPHERRPLDGVFSNWFYSHCSAFMALSENVASELKTFAPNKPVHVHPHPVYDIFGEPVNMDVARRHLNLDPTTPYILFFGFVRKYKGLDLLLEAMADPAVAATGAELIVAGEFYEDKTPYLHLIEKLGIGSRVRIYDQYISDSEVKYYFSAANIVAQTYRSATQSGVTQIAFQMGRPMLVTNVGGLSEIVANGKNGFVCDPSKDAIAASLSRYFMEKLETPFSREVYAQRGLFSWQQYTKRFLNFIQHLRPQ